jgi:hypothetical protein
MKKVGLWISLVLAAALPATAQVTVEVTQPQQQYLPGEAMEVAVRITNRSGQSLHLGDEENWLTFSIDSRDGIVVPKLADPPVAGEFVLDSSKVAIKRVDLVPYFMLTTPGRYEILATVHISDWKRDVTSLPKPFDLIQGTKLWEQEVGVPITSGDTNAAPELRRFILQQANYIKGQLRLYLRVTDGLGKAIKVFPVGQMVSFSHPEPQVDKLSNLHLLYQNAPHSYSYTVCDLNGEITMRRTYDYLTSRPRLRVSDEGEIQVVGGSRHVTPNDVPEPTEEELSAPPAPPADAGSTNRSDTATDKKKKAKSAS